MPTRLRMRSVLTLVVILLLADVPAFAQMETGTLSGVIQDPKGAVVPDVEVSATRIETGTVLTTKSNGAGIYFFTGLIPGHYHLTLRKPGFKEIAIKDFQLYVQDKLEQNFSLEIGSVSETVTVEAGAFTINTTDASVSTVVDRQFAENLPLNGRSFQTLLQLTPGVVLMTSNPEDNGQFSVNGQRAASNYWMVDGVSANIGIGSSTAGNGFGGTLGSFSAFGGTNSLVSVDALEEFRVQTSTYAPEFGRTPGGQISIVTRSGTNQFHGTAFDYLRNDILDANDWFADRAALPKAKERQNDFGGTFSGPIVKGRTFFFFSYEGLRLRLPQTTLTEVPDVLARQNAVPSMQPYLNAFPLPTPSAIDDPATGIAQYTTGFSNPASLDAYSLRIDQKLSDKLMLFGRYNYSPSEIAQRAVGGQTLNTVHIARITTQTATVGATWLAAPTVTNDFRFNYSRTNASSHSGIDNFGGAVPLPSLPIPSPFTGLDSQFQFQIGSLSLGDLLVAGRNAKNLQRQFNIVDNLSLQRGSHSLKFGVDFRRLSPQTAPPSYNQLASFSDVPSAQAGNSAFAFIAASHDATVLFRNLGAFGQDTWRISPRATLTYGLRWDLDFAPSSLNGPSIPSVTGYSLTDFSQLAVAPSGTAPFKMTFGNVSPRLGLAYQLTQSQAWQTVLRGGFGVFYDLVSSETGNAISPVTPPFGNFKLVFGPGPVTFPFTPEQAAAPPIPPSGVISSLFVFNPNLKLPYTLQWNVALEQGLGKEQTITASYIGASGRRLLQTSVAISPPTNPNLIGDFVDNTATSDYDALQVQYRRRLSRGLQGLVSYTWSHSIDDGSTGSFELPSNVGIPGNQKANRGPSDFDIRNGLSAGVTYDIPAPKGNAFAKAILRGWSSENFVVARSSPPAGVSDFNALLLACNLSGGISAEFRPDLVPGQPLYLHGSQYPGGKAFNPAAFSHVPADPLNGCPLRQGNVPRNFLRGFGATQWDSAIHREFALRESVKLQFRAEMFNVLNHPNFGQPYPFFGLPLFGMSQQMLGQSLNGSNLGGGAFNPLYQIGGPRSIQFALKLSF